MSHATIFTIFGATGDLTQRKLLPALYFLESERVFKDNTFIVCVARKPMTDSDFRKEATLSIMKHSRIKVKDELLEKLLKRISYVQLDFSEVEHYKNLKEYIENLSGEHCAACERIFYLAIPPDLFAPVVGNMDSSGLVKQAKTGPKTRVVFEKPFGHDLASSKQLNKVITSVFDESQIYRIDHYLAKELVQNLLVMRFGNALFEPLWNKDYIDHIQITVAESLGVESRAGYYEHSGSLRDVMQNHIMQLLCLVAMTAPKSMGANDIRDKKVEVLKAIAKTKNLARHAIKGQYDAGEINGVEVAGYRQEKGINPKSIIDTYTALKIEIPNSQWRGVPFYVRTGKRLQDRATEIVVVYKHTKSPLLRHLNVEQNKLVIRVQPDEGMIMYFNAKVPGNRVVIEEVSMDFCHECKFGPNSPESYERLLHDVMQSDQTLFTRWDEVEQSWKIIDQIADSFEKKQPSFYDAGTWGPKEANTLIEKDGRKWVAPKKPNYAQLLGK